jgi:hypothetical protein
VGVKLLASKPELILLKNDEITRTLERFLMIELLSVLYGIFKAQDLILCKKKS